MNDILQKADGFRLSVDPTPDDVNEANWLIDRLSAKLAEVEAERDALETRCQMISSHATGGGTAGIGKSVNDVCVEITRFRNVLWDDAKRSGAKAAEAALVASYRLALEDAAKVAASCDLGIDGNVGDRVARLITRSIRAMKGPKP